MDKEQKISKVQARLPHSEVFPKYIQDMLLRDLSGLAEKQLDLLIEILKKEEDEISKII